MRLYFGLSSGGLIRFSDTSSLTRGNKEEEETEQEYYPTIYASEYNEAVHEGDTTSVDGKEKGSNNYPDSAPTTNKWYFYNAYFKLSNFIEFEYMRYAYEIRGNQCSQKIKSITEQGINISLEQLSI